jgi:hypothetical protein
MIGSPSSYLLWSGITFGYGIHQSLTSRNLPSFMAWNKRHFASQNEEEMWTNRAMDEDPLMSDMGEKKRIFYIVYSVGVVLIIIERPQHKEEDQAEFEIVETGT